MNLGVLWKANTQTGALELNNPSEYLKTELGVSLRAIQDSNTIKAVKDPEGFINDRSAEIDKLFGANGAITSYFGERLKKLIDLKLPSEVAKDLAMKSANRFYQEQLEILEITMPGAYQRAFGIAGLEHNTTIAKADIATAGDRKAIISEYKIRKRAKRAARRSGK